MANKDIGQVVASIKGKLIAEKAKAKNKDNKKLDEMLERVELCEAFTVGGLSK